MLHTFTILPFFIGLSLGLTQMEMAVMELFTETSYHQAPWENITLWCSIPSRVYSKSLLLKDKTQMFWVQPTYKTFQVSFPIGALGALTESSAGLYRCYYWQEIGCAEPSQILELEAPGQLPKSIFSIEAKSSTLSRCNVSILCHGLLPDLILTLFKEGYAGPVDYQIPTGTVAIFSTDNLTHENEGVYICHTRIQMLLTLWSEPSDPLKVVIAAGLYPKPTLTAYPGLTQALGESLNLRCQGPIYGMTFALMRLEDMENTLYHKKTIKNEANFFFRALKVNDAGHYLCFYYDGSYRGSLLSEILKIWVTDKPPKPSLSAWPSTTFKLGQVLTLQCRAPHPVLEFSLEWEERAKPPTCSVDADFMLSNVGGKSTGTYGCRYRIHPDVCSHRGKPLKLMGPAGTVTWNYVLNEAIRLSLILQLIALLSVVLWIRWKCQRLRVREAWLLGTAQRVTMLFLVMAFLCCGLCNGVVTEETEIIMPTPKPELWAETNFPLAPWKNLTLWCRSPSGSTKEFVLLKDRTGWIATRPASKLVRAAFPLGALTQSHIGSYHCHSWEEMAVSEPSEALELVGTDILPKPVISAPPPIRGQELQIRCKGWLAGMGFALYKEGEHEPVQQLGAVGKEAFFTIPRMEDKDEGNYSCHTHTESRPFKWSVPSEPLELVIKELYPKPFFKTLASPMVILGDRVTFNCSSAHQHMSFILYKDGSEIASNDGSWESPGASAAHFLIISVGIGDGGNYTCRYYDFATWSEPSDPVELVVTDFYPKPTLLAQPGPVVLPGKNVTLRCQGAFQGMRFALLQEGTQDPLQFQSASGYLVDFLLHAVGAENSGNYSCVYYETTMSNRASHLSTPIMIWVTDTFPKPWLYAEPSSVIPMGKNVTLWCQGPVLGVGYILQKEGDVTSMPLWGSSRDDGAFLITNTSGASTGRYSCCYHPDWTSPIKLQPSNTLELIVTGLLPKPTLVAQPGPLVTPGENMTLQCQGELPDSTFVLVKEGAQQPLEKRRSSGSRADFWMPAVRNEDSGIYSCVYYLNSAPFAASNHSDPMEIWVTDKPPKPLLSAWPSAVFKLGKDITLQCRGPLPGVEFVLEHDGEDAPQQFSEDGDFVINNVEGKGIGNYSCSYRLQANPDIWSEPSDTLELVGAAGPVAQECTVGNIVRSTLIVVVVLALGVVLAIEWKKWPRLRTRGSDTDGRDQSIALEECIQEIELGTTTNSPSSISQETSEELPALI
ncbi:immunoglobulin superfamily member 1 [Echinops telfairi]|uniref:immunoglobulin superfamily member 1 n=1 Tax=Echinops telfairi TaxID=9371 RepID=UPI001E1DE5B2|nr:immunoglobulin superfamily member 1 [Echinops telfairi]